MSRPAHDFSTIEPEVLDEDLTPGDLVFALEHTLQPEWPQLVTP